MRLCQNTEHYESFFFLMIRRPPRSTLFPYTTLFRSPFTFAALERVLTQEEKIFTSMDVRPITSDRFRAVDRRTEPDLADRDRKSTRLNSSHANISYAVFCLKKKKNLYQTFACPTTFC